MRRKEAQTHIRIYKSDKAFLERIMNANNLGQAGAFRKIIRRRRR
jgi:hypothetical protein